MRKRLALASKVSSTGLPFVSCAHVHLNMEIDMQLADN